MLASVLLRRRSSSRFTQGQSATMPSRSSFRLFSALTIFAITATSLAHAACHEKDQETKINQLSALVTPLAQKDPPRAQKISEEMMTAMTLDGDAACTKLDDLIARAK